MRRAVRQVVAVGLAAWGRRAIACSGGTAVMIAATSMFARVAGVRSDRASDGDCHCHGRCPHHAELLRLRRDLHDGLGPALTGLAMRLDAALRDAELGDPDLMYELLDRQRGEVTMALVGLRRIVAGRTARELDGRGIGEALRELVDRMSGAGAAVPDISIEVDLSGLVRRDHEVTAYWIAMEALHNVLRHSGARTCHVRVWSAAGLRLEVVDDGIGGVADWTEGVGLASMRDRAREAGGRLEVLDRPGAGGGVVVRVFLPA